MEHLTNCHGEWNALVIALSSIPFIGMWLKYKLSTHKHGEEQ